MISYEAKNQQFCGGVKQNPPPPFFFEIPVFQISGNVIQQMKKSLALIYRPDEVGTSINIGILILKYGTSSKFGLRIGCPSLIKYGMFYKRSIYEAGYVSS